MAQAASGSSKIDTKAPTSADEAAQPKSYGDLVSTLPARGGWVSLVQYQNYWLNPGRLQNIIPVKELYKPRADDIVLATYLKCGTTWLKALAFAITTRGRHHQAFAAADHPLLTVHPQEAVPHLEVHTPGQGLADIERLPSPRLLGTHLPLSLLPPAVATSGCRVVYLCRQPKDVFVSLWHFVKGMRGGRSPVELDAALAMFCEGVSPFGPVWEHYLEYWKESLARPERVLFLRYEEMVADPVRAVRTLAGFFAVPFTDEEEGRGVPEEIVRLCSFEMLSGLESNRTGDLDCGDNTVIGKSTFFRKGKVGDWENHLTKEMGKKVDAVFEDKLQGSGLVF
ncbi:flavonol 4-sulfotransferase isoform X1 [Zea mays]|jgi:hydroxyjasmonate sulfotransferase|uniref:Sulfotransferase n=1 Tax=Zea mays TaxID=4577 RepID=B6TRN9_MAIZE|nr:flavonol 4-sulfotransferase [Zea mays]XP_008678405.1 flavonol 4-sulfotransferase isoform X1 [Zea mays]ACG39772.1 flavonol 4-sulfotransferase [Zea mays]ONM07747.1 Flavonol 4-sulfotransferase [Zea mays]ONM07748.1 Flavonol 4-sulfotransferase [Zea mays]|eukprot:NP_001150618.1 flavonol 4-sulfotransferase [Zea mays]